MASERTSAAAILLGAGRPYRGIEPSAIQETPDHRRVLDWILDAFSSVDAAFQFVGGYHIEDIARRYPRITYILNPEWESSGSVSSLLKATLAADSQHYVSYSDIVFRRNVVEALGRVDGDVVIGVDRQWRTRYAGRSARDMDAAEKVMLSPEMEVTAIGRHVKTMSADAEFIGLTRFSPRAVSRLLQFRQVPPSDLAGQHIGELIDMFVREGFRVRGLNVQGDWAELNAPQDLARFVLGTKAETLERLRPLVRRSVIGAQKVLTYGHWRKNAEDCLDAVDCAFPGVEVAVRSSATSEDTWLAANAGTFLSVLNVPSRDRRALNTAVERVFASLPQADERNQVLVQEMVQSPRVSGVVFTRTLSVGAPYYVINYDDASGRTDTVTAGERDSKTYVVHRDVQELPADAPSFIQDLLHAAREIEGLVGHDALDIEFAITEDGNVHVLQSRPIVLDPSLWRDGDRQLAALLRGASDDYERRNLAGISIIGQRPIYSLMSDWNPAEMIGTRPALLAFSLYRRLVTDEVWAAQRAEYGYRDVRPQPLMIKFAGHPFIDVRASFNSFIPAALADATATKLIDAYSDRLAAEPHLHDKIEFEIALTCLTFDFDERAQRLYGTALNAVEIADLKVALREITVRGIARCAADVAQVQHLIDRRKRTIASQMAPLERAFSHLDDCRRFGTLPFAHVARSAFVATALLRSAVTVGFLTHAELDSYLNSFRTVTGQFADALAEMRDGKRSLDALVAEYGHLRPGTYDITSPCYASDPERFFNVAQMPRGSRRSEESTGLSQYAIRRIDEGLRTLGLDIGFTKFDAFARAAIEGREYTKFVFSKNLSLALEDLAEYGEEIGVSRDVLSHIAIDDFARLRIGDQPPDIPAWLHEQAARNSANMKIVRGVELPPVLAMHSDLHAFSIPKAHPNFIGSGCVTAQIVHCERVPSGAFSIAGRIALIPQADPGFDWLFAQGISGLVVAYGGANSHMAIRAAEFNLPAVIGVGEAMFERLARATTVAIDCARRHVAVIR